jgi:hypothetical protein
MGFDDEYGVAGDSMPNKVAQGFNTGLIKRANDNKALGGY